MVQVCMEEETIGQRSPSFGLYVKSSSSCFIYRLPTEILEGIFIHCACNFHSHDKGGIYTPTAPSWVNVSYVSRLWRDVAVNCETLWTYLFVTSPRWTEELLARSKQAPLKLHLLAGRWNQGSRELCFLEQVTNHLDRIQELRLHFPFAYNALCPKFLSKLTSRPAPRLRHLEISADNLSHWSSLLFDGDTPALRTLDLTGCSVQWYLFKLSNLTTLILLAVPDRFQQNTADFLATLSSMQDLEHLFLLDALASAAGFLSSAAFSSFRKFVLPRLSRLDISCPLSTAIALLSCVKISLGTQIRLQCDVEHYSSSLDDYASLCSLLAQRFGCMYEDRTLSDPTIRTLTIAPSTDRSRVKIAFSALERDCDPLPPSLTREWFCNVPLQIVLSFSGSMSISDRELLISRICCPIPLPSVHALHVFTPSFLPPFLTYILGHLQGLRYIKLFDGHMPDLVSVLSLTSHDPMENKSARGGSSPMYAAALEELELSRVIFSSVLERDTGPRTGVDVQSLCDVLSTRKKPRGRLTMTRCIECHPDNRENVFDMAGWWEGGRFHVVEKHDSDASNYSDGRP